MYAWATHSMGSGTQVNQRPVQGSVRQSTANRALQSYYPSATQVLLLKGVVQQLAADLGPRLTAFRATNGEDIETAAAGEAGGHTSDRRRHLKERRVALLTESHLWRLVAVRQPVLHASCSFSKGW